MSNYIDLNNNGRLFPSWVLSNFKQFKLPENIIKEGEDPCKIKTKLELRNYQKFISSYLDYRSPYKEILLGSKFSLGYVDGSLSYKLLFDSDSQAQAVGFSAGHIQNYYGGLNYTFMDAFEFGPLSIGLGLIKQNKFASLVDQSSGGPYTKTTTPALSVEDSHSWGVLFSAKQKIGRNSGLRFYVEKLGFSAIKTDGSLKIKASPIRVASLSFYTNIDQWSFTK